VEPASPPTDFDLASSARHTYDFCSSRLRREQNMTVKKAYLLPSNSSQLGGSNGKRYVDSTGRSWAVDVIADVQLGGSGKVTVTLDSRNAHAYPEGLTESECEFLESLPYISTE
jgi:hypothetical protein